MIATIDESTYREMTHAATTPSVQQSLPDQWVDWGGHTVTVDPMNNKQWIHDSHDGHARSEERGRFYDRKQVNELMNWEKSHAGVEAQYYTPRIGDKDRFNPSMMDQTRGCRSWRGVIRDSTRFGELPSISALIYENKLGDKSREQIESEIREQDRRLATRIFDRT